MRYKILTLLIYVSCGLLPCTAEQRTLRISAGEWPPYLSNGIEQQGLIAHLITDIFADEGYAVKFSFLPWPRAYSATTNGRFDATAIWMYTSEREADFLFSAPVLNEKFVFFHLKNQPFDWQTFQDLNGMIIGGGLEYSYGPQFDAYLKTGAVTMERVSSDKQNFGKLLKERITLYPQELHVGYTALRSEFSKHDIIRITHHPAPFLENVSHVIFPKKSKNSRRLLKLFNARLRQYRESGKYQEYFDKLQTGYYAPIPRRETKK